MSLLNPGYWHSNYWPSSYWHEDYWPDWASAAVGFKIGHIFIDPMSGEIKKLMIDVIARSLNVNPGDILIEVDGSEVYVLVKDPIILPLN